ncbi:MAG: hypothetical protein GX786_00390, partial [Clostridiales bacterium]|nr:hypothetical protein [Clostridiales bacterium]
ELEQIADQIYVFSDTGDVYKGPLNGEVPFPEMPPKGNVFSYLGNIFYQSLEMPELVFACNQNIQGGTNLLLMASSLAKIIFQSNDSIENVYDVYRRLLREEIIGTDISLVAQEYRIPYELERTVLVFHVENIEKHSAFELLKEIIPQSEKDLLIEMDRRTSVLLLESGELKTLEDRIQFSKALQETILTETGEVITIGIGEKIKNLEKIGVSYRQGKKAIEIGNVFLKKNTIFPYEKMIIERFLAELPKEITQKYPSMVFNRRTARLFNDEMLQTIEMFFEKDLNLSDTARQLYIHRNTLVYRLDKIEKVMGLDLRKFYDAVTFKLLLEMRKSANEIFTKEEV